MRACILAVGDEIVGGLTADTNSGFLSRLLRSAGVEVIGFQAVPDEPDAILLALRRGLDDADVVLVTGGLGPTADDLTTGCVATLLGVPLELHGPTLATIRERFRSRGLEMPENNRKQAMLPRGCEVVPNSEGTAPGFICRSEGRRGAGHVVCLPGVPREMRKMAEEAVLPWMGARMGGVRIGYRVFSTSGLTESRLDELLAGAVAPGEGRLSFRAAFPRLQARVTVTAASQAELEERLAAIESRVRERLGEHLYATDDEGLEETVARLLRARSLTLAVAESCTGGLIGHRITEVAGSSDYFVLGVVAYSDAMKERLLGVSPHTLAIDGAVSEATAREMAAGARRAAEASIGVATTGIAGPGGGSPEKPVGTVCIALDADGFGWSRRFDVGARSRAWVKETTAQLALDALRRHLEKCPEEG
jgi:nicotinamide-nucleotide amidase